MISNSSKRSMASGTASRQKRSYKIRTAIAVALVTVVFISIGSAFLAAQLITGSSIQRYFNQCGNVGRNQMEGPSARGAMKSVNQGFIIASVIAASLGLLMSILLARIISKPLTELTGTVRRTIGGNYSQRAEVTGSTEVEDLGEAFNMLLKDLDDKETLRKNMVTDIAHELRNPLATIKAQLEGIEDGVIRADAPAIKSISEDVELLSRLVDDLRELAVVESGQLNLERMPVDIRVLIEAVVSRYSKDLKDGGIESLVEIDPGLKQMSADPDRLFQVLSNLVKNSIYHCDKGSRITIGARQLDGEIEISISDTGTGIAPEDLPFIFERFYRRELSPGRKGGIAGIGLTVTRNLVEAHGGTIRAESESGKGTKITFTIPEST